MSMEGRGGGEKLCICRTLRTQNFFSGDALRGIILFAGGGGVQGLFSCNFTSEFKKLKFSSVDL